MDSNSELILPKIKIRMFLRGERKISDILKFILPGLLEPIKLPDGKINPKALLALCFIIIGGVRLRTEGKCSGLLLVASQTNWIHSDFQKIVIYLLGKARFGNCENFQNYFEENFGNYSEIILCFGFIKKLSKRHVGVSEI